MLGLPADDTMIWRYMSLTQFLDLLQRRSMWFSRLSALQSQDPYEGMLPEQCFWNVPDHHVIDWEQGETVYKAVPGKIVKRTRHQLDLPSDWMKHVFVNCWHICDHEYPAMWEIYSGGEGIAVISTVGSLRSVLPTSEIELHRMQYVDFESPDEIELSSLFCKRRHFEYENELRAYFEGPKWKSKQPGQHVNIDREGGLRSLIRRIVISPLAPPFLESVVRDVLPRYDLADQLVQSSALRIVSPSA